MKPSKSYLLLALLYVTIVATDCLWFSLDDRPPIWDMAVHLATAFDFYESFKHFSFSWAAVKSFILLGKFYPTLFPALMGFFFLLFGPSVYVGAAANFVPLGILIFATYRIGRKIFSENVGRLASFLVVTYPIMAWLAREALLDFSLVAAVTLATWIYLETDNFSNTRVSWGYGLVFALGFLTKHGFIFYAAPLALFAVYELITRDESPLRRRSARLRNFLWAHLVGIAGWAIWYVPHWKDVREYFFLNRQLHSVLQQPEFMTAPSLLYTLDALTRVQMLFVPFVFLLLGVFISLRRFARQALILYCCGFGSLVIMTFTIVHREVRMSVASLPFFALLTAAGLMEIESSRWRRMGVTALVGSAAIEFGLMTFGIGAWRDSVHLFKSPNLEINLYAQTYAQLTGPPRREDWKIVPILKATWKDASQQNLMRPRLGVIPDLPRFNHFDFILYSKLESIPVVVERAVQISDEASSRPVNYFILKTGSQGEPGTTRLNAESNQWIQQHPERFEKIAGYDLPDGSQAHLYRQRSTPRVH